MRAAVPRVKNIYSYVTGEFLGLARVVTWDRKRSVPWGRGPFPAGTVVSTKGTSSGLCLRRRPRFMPSSRGEIKTPSNGAGGRDVDRDAAFAQCLTTNRAILKSRIRGDQASNATSMPK